MNNNPPNPTEDAAFLRCLADTWVRPNSYHVFGGTSGECADRIIAIADRLAQPPPYTALGNMEMCDACNGAGDDGHGHICGKCDGAGGYPPHTDLTDVERVAAAIKPNLFRLYPGGKSQAHERARQQARAAIAAMPQQPVHANEDELGDGSDFGVTGEWWGNADEVELALVRVGQDLEAAKRDGLTTNTLFNIADVRTLRAAVLVSNRSGVEQRVREAFYEGFYSAEANSSSVAWHWKNSDARAALDTEKEK